MQPVAPPPAFANTPQFTAEYWDKIRRDMKKLKLVRVTKVDDEFHEYVFDDNSAFMRRDADTDPAMFALLHANLEVFVQSIRGELVTGLFIPEHGWVFKMTGEQLAEYARKLTTSINNQRAQAREELTQFLTEAIVTSIKKMAEITLLEEAIDIIGPINPRELATDLIDALDSVGRKQ